MTTQDPIKWDARLLEERAAWLRRLAGDAPTSVPGRRNGDDGMRHAVRHERRLSGALTTLLDSATGGSAPLVFTAAVAAMLVTAWRYTGSRRVMAASPALRGQVSANLVLSATTLDPGETFGALLSRVRATLADAAARASYPFLRLVDELGWSDLVREGVVAVIGLRMEGLHGPVPREAVPALLVELLRDGAGVRVGLEIAPGHLDECDADRILATWQHVLQAGLSAPGAALSALPAVSPADAELLEGFAGDRAVARTRLAPEMLAHQAAERPSLPAIEAPDGTTISYGDLHQRVERLAGLLAGLGVTAEVRVGLCLERTADVVVAQLAVLRAGGAFVPLDPEYPAERLAFMLRDSAVRIVLGHRAMIARLPAGTRAVAMEELTYDGLAVRLPPPESFRGDQLAYVIYTSGSTGTPKGVMIDQRNLARLATSAASALAMSPGSRVAQFASTSFDASIWEIYSTLFAGGRILLVRPEDRVLGAELSRQLRERRVSHLFLPPSAWGTVPPADLPDLEVLIIGGEPCPRELAARWAPGRRFLNAYGPTETTVYTTLGDWSPVDADVPIGRPLGGYSVHVLDEELRRVPVGGVGELCIGGEGVGRGYLGRPDLTAERFVPDPYSPRPGGRLYRSGDLLRFLPDGRLEYVARVDTMVKVRGFRIELGEVEAALGRLPGICACAALVERDEAGGRRLVAFVAGEGAASAEGLRERLLERLPAFMVPERIRVLGELPLNANGKIDRRALAGMPSTETLAEPDARGASLEAALLSTWQEVLARAVGPDDDFFRVGGHSLLAVRLQGAIRERMAREMPLAALFQHRTVRRLAAWLARSVPAAPSALVPMRAEGSRAPFFCVHPSGGDVLCYAELGAALGPDRPFFALQDPAVAGGPTFRSVEELAAVYLAEVDAAAPGVPLRVGGWSMGGLIAYEMARQRLAAGGGVGAVLLLDSQPPDRLPDAGPDGGDGAMLLAVLRRMEQVEGRSLLPMTGAAFLAEEVDRQVDVVLDVARGAGLLPDESSREDVLRRLQTLRHHEALVCGYRPGLLHADVTLLRAAEVPPASSAEGAAPAERSLGWDRYVRGALHVVEVPGDHLTMMAKWNLAPLAREVSAALARADGEVRATTKEGRS